MPQNFNYYASDYYNDGEMMLALDSRGFGPTELRDYRVMSDPDVMGGPNAGENEINLHSMSGDDFERASR